MNQFFRRLSFCRVLLLGFLFALLPLQQASADIQTDAHVLASHGQWREALIATNRYLSDHPNDASMLFLKGIILTQQDKRGDAIETFKRLTEKHPTLPEAYNNLAALYAAEGQYEKARATLEAGLRTNPAYATAYENLGIVYAKLSSQAYEKALQTKTSPNTGATQLAMLRSLSTDASNTKVQGTILAVAPKPAAIAPTPAAPPPLKASAEPAPQVDTTSSPSTQPTGSKATEDAVAQTLTDWAAAWSARDIKKYLSFYASDFKTPRGKSRKAWEEERRIRIVGKKNIRVKVFSPQVTLSGNTAKAKFKQAYSSNRFSSTTGKTMVFVKENSEWKIRQEMSN